MKKKVRFLFCGLALLAALFAGGCGGKDEEPPEEEPVGDEPQEDEQESGPQESLRTPVEAAKTLAEALRQSAGVTDGLEEPDHKPEPAETTGEENGEAEEKLAISLAETINYVEQMDPALLGLEGENMDEYEVLPNQFIVPVDGLLCSELLVYSRNGKTGTNELVEKLLVSRGPERRLYRLEDDTNEVVPLARDQDLASDALASQTQNDPSAKAGEESG